MNTCQKCRYWTRNVESEFGSDSAIFGTCANPKLAYGRTNGEEQTVDYALHPVGLPRFPGEYRGWVEGASILQCADMLLYEDYSGYDAVLQTGEDFGCIHWEMAAA